MSIEVDYVLDAGESTGNITIGKKPLYPTKKMFNLDIGKNSSPALNTNDEEFTIDQRHLRALDCMKDAKIEPNVSHSVYPALYPGLVPIPFDTLHELEDKFTNAFKPKIRAYSWLKVSSDSELGPKIPKCTVFKESGLDPERFIDHPNFCGNFANEVIDPAGRSPIELSKRDGKVPDIRFPAGNNSISLSEQFLKLFGFNKCSLKAVYTGGKYNYQIDINDVKITAPLSKDGDFGYTGKIGWFQGNKQKNDFIKNKLSGKNTDKVKNGLFLAKEMGDVLQVLLMFIWVILNPDLQYAMVTVDKVVLLQCMMLGINCILTNAEQPVKGKPRLRSILFFEPTGDTEDKVITRFNKERECITKHNNEFLKCIKFIINKPNQFIDVPGVGEFILPEIFYKKIEIDVNKINDMLNDPAFLTKTTQDDAGIRFMKANYMVNLFLRKLKTSSVKMTFAKKYTEKDAWIAEYTPVISDNSNYGKKSFYEISREPHTAMIGGDKRPRSPSQSNGLSYLEFADGHFPGEKENPYIVETKDRDENNEFVKIDVLASFKTEVLEIMKTKYNSDKWNVHVFSALYHHFYIHEEVLYDTDLQDLIVVIMNDAIETVKRIVSEAPKKKSVSHSSQRKATDLYTRKNAAKIKSTAHPHKMKPKPSALSFFIKKHNLSMADIKTIKQMPVDKLAILEREVVQHTRKRSNVYMKNRKIHNRHMHSSGTQSSRTHSSSNGMMSSRTNMNKRMRNNNYPIFV
jgi:hypothetical protein